MNPAAVHAIAIVLAFAVLVAAAVVTAAWLDRPKPALRWADARLAGWLSPPPGDHHRFTAPDAERITETPAPEHGPGQVSRPGDPHAPTCAVPAGATPLDEPVPYWPAYLPAPAALTPVPQPAAVITSPRDGGPLPQSPSGAPPVAADFPGLGQHPFAGEAVQRPPWVIWHGDAGARREPPPGLLAIGYEPFHHGPKAVVPSPSVSLRVTGAHAAIPSAQAALVRPAARRHFDHVDRWWTP